MQGVVLSNPSNKTISLPEGVPTRLTFKSAAHKLGTSYALTVEVGLNFGRAAL